MDKTEQRLPKQQQMNKTKLTQPDTQHQLNLSIQYWLTIQYVLKKWTNTFAHV